MKRLTKIFVIICLCLLAGIITWFTATGTTAYLYACYLESKWHPESPQTKAELEKHLNLYSLHHIDPKTSMWGRDYQLNKGERMLQYRILWSKNCPLDVVYDDADNIMMIFTSYE